MKKKLTAPDPLAALASALLTIAGILGFEEMIDMTASELAILLGSVGTVAASARHLWNVRRAGPATVAPSDVDTLTGDPDAPDGGPE